MMPTSKTRLIRFASVLAWVVSAGSIAAQTPVEAVSVTSGALQRARTLLAEGQRDSATELLGRHLAEQSNDGLAWFFLGRIYLADAQQWHRSGHPANVSPTTMLEFASTSFEPAQELLTDSGGVFRVLVAVERATLRIENGGWESLAGWQPSAEELPLPPVLVELGRNLLASCPRNGVLLTGSLTEAAAVWGVRLLGARRDLVLLRPDMYEYDARYRGRMAAAIGADSAEALPQAVATAAATRPICLAPSVDSIGAPGVTWHRARLVLATSPVDNASAAQLSMFQFGRTGLAGSVWTSAARDDYDLAARRDASLCHTLFVNTDVLTLPTISACTP